MLRGAWRTEVWGFARTQWKGNRGAGLHAAPIAHGDGPRNRTACHASSPGGAGSGRSLPVSPWPCPGGGKCGGGTRPGLGGVGRPISSVTGGRSSVFLSPAIVMSHPRSRKTTRKLPVGRRPIHNSTSWTVGTRAGVVEAGHRRPGGSWHSTCARASVGIREGEIRVGCERQDLGQDLGLDLGQNLGNVRTGEGRHTRLLTSDRRPDGVAGDADDPVLLAQQVASFVRLAAQADGSVGREATRVPSSSDRATDARRVPPVHTWLGREGECPSRSVTSTPDDGRGKSLTLNPI
ncbi:hypothetical protein MPEAHAMD_4671 [Methylobacterium frigidaeris]|uniref:Uncharacterized protein n=1 Tax=Methylobacterium frigidaeris TaxID=2038277 RepID=A0AA37HEL4_9HYPH|nr:hypothetical protein MPEAHAMD_4671 [Methylobacterium frigidaeris]